MDENCGNCARSYRLQKSDYSQGGCIHTDMEGYICMAFAAEGIAEWMAGLNPDLEVCECYEERKRNVRMFIECDEE